MTNEQMIEDFKQFIATTVSQATANMATKDDIAGLEAKMNTLASKEDVARVEGKVDDLNLKVDTIADSQAEQLHEHDQRLRRLETSAA